MVKCFFHDEFEVIIGCVEIVGGTLLLKRAALVCPEVVGFGCCSKLIGELLNLYILFIWYLGLGELK